MANGKQNNPKITASQQEQITKAAAKTGNAYKATLAVIDAINKGLIKTESQLTTVLGRLGNADFKSLQKLSTYIDDGTDGFKNWQKELERVEKLSGKAVDKEIERKKLSKDALKNLNEYKDTQEEILEDLEDIVDKSTEWKDLSKEVFDLNGALKNVMASLSAEQVSQLNTLTSINTTYDSITANVIDQMNQLSNFNIPNVFDSLFPSDEPASIEKVYDSILKNLGNDTFEVQGEAGLDFDSAYEKVTKFGSDVEKSLDARFTNITTQIANKFGTQTGLIQKYIMSLGDSSIQLSIDEKGEIDSLLASLPDVGDISKQSFGLLTANALESQKKIAVLKGEIDKFNATLASQKSAREFFKGIDAAVEDVSLSIQRQIDTVMPDWAQSFFGVRESISAIKEASKQSLNAAVQQLANGGSIMQSLQTYSSGLITNFNALLGPLARMGLMLGGALIALTAMWKLMTSLENTAKEYSTQLGTSRQRGAELYKQTLDIVSASNNRLATEKDVQEILKSHQEKYGTILDLSKQSNQDMIKFAASLGKTYGISSAEAAGLVGQFKNMGASMEESKGLSLWLAQASELAGISFSEVTKDLAESTREVALYYQGMPKQAAKAVIQIKKLGMSMKQVGKVMDKSLDIGTFYQDMTELSIMTGGAANLQKFFDLRFSGAKPDELAGEIADQFDRMVESGEDNEFNLRKFAEATGMEVEELLKSRKIRKELVGLSAEQQKKLNQHLDSLTDADLANSDAAMAAAERLDTQDKMNVAMDKMKAVLMKALLPLAESLSEAFSAGIPFLNVIGDILKGIGAVLSYTIIPAFQGVMIPISFIGNLLKDAYDFTVKLFGAAEDTEGAVGGIGEQVKNVIKYISAGITTMFLLSGNFSKAFTWPFQVVKSLIPGMKGGLFDVFKSAGGGVKSLGQKIFSMFKGSEDGTKSLGSKITAMFKGGEDGSKSLAQRMKDLFKGGEDGSKSLTERIKSIFKGGEDGSKSLTDKLKEFFKGGEDGSKSLTERFKSLFSSDKKPAETIAESVTDSEPLTSAAEKISAPDTKSVTESAKKTGGIFSKLGETLKSIGNGIKKTLEFIVDFITKSLKKIVNAVSDSLQSLAKAIGNSLKAIGKGIGDTVASISKGIGTGLSSIVKGVSDSLSSLAKSIGTALSSIGTGVGKFIESVLSGIGKGLSTFKANALMGAASLVVVAGALWIMADAIKKFTAVGWEDLGKAMVALGGLALLATLLSKASSSMLMGAAAILVLGAAMIPLAYGLSLMKDVGIESMIALGGSLIILGAAAAILGPMLPVILLGAVAIAALGAAMIPLAYALNQAAPAIAEIGPIIESFGTIINSVFNGLATVIETAANSFSMMIEKFASLDPTSLFGAAAGITAIGLALAAFGGGSALSGIGSAFGEIFGGDPIEKFQKFAELAGPLKASAQAMTEMNASIEKMTSLDSENLDATANSVRNLADALSSFGGGSALTGIGTALGEMFGGDPVEKLERFAALASPLQIVADSIDRISQSLNSLSESLSNIDLSKLDAIKDSAQPGLFSSITKSLFGESKSEPNSETMTENKKYLQSVNTPVNQSIEAQKAIATDGMTATTPTTNVQVEAPAVKTQTQNGSFKDVQSALLAIANRPIIVKIGDVELKTLNKQFRGMNNNV